MLTINEKLRSYRLSSGLSQETVAKKLGLKRTTITAIENGDRKLLAEELLDFSRIYDVPVETLLNDNDENELIDFVREFRRLSLEDKQDLLHFIRKKNEVSELAL